MKYAKSIYNGYITACGSLQNGVPISQTEYVEILGAFLKRPKNPEGYTYKLRADNLEWELVKLPPIELEPLTEEQALTRYANSITGANDQTLVEAAETLITERIKEE